MIDHSPASFENSPSCEPASSSSFLPLPSSDSSPASSPSTATETVHVLHLINGEHYAGAERVQDLLAKRLPEFGYDVGFACVKLDAFDEMRESRNAPLYNVPMRARYDLWAAYKLAKIVREENYRLIHGHTVRTAMLGGIVSRMTGIPLVCHAHSPASRDSTRRWMNRVNGLVHRLSLQNVSRVIAVSQAMAEHIANEGFDPMRIRVVPNGVPGPVSLPHHPTPAGRWTLGTVALFRPRKGLEVLLDAMAILLRQGIPLHLRAVGTFESSKYEAEIAARIRQLGLNEYISWSGFTRQIDAELRKMDLLVLPSLFGEGMPMVVLEAMAAGVPVVATRVPGVPEMIRHGQDGVLANPNDANKLAEAIAGVVNDCYNWEKMRVCAFERHALQFSDRAMAAGVASVYKEVLPPRKTHADIC
jgi:glycosyltransferase involved in cell wall biosynthesis